MTEIPEHLLRISAERKAKMEKVKSQTPLERIVEFEERMAHLGEKGKVTVAQLNPLNNNRCRMCNAIQGNSHRPDCFYLQSQAEEELLDTQRVVDAINSNPGFRELLRKKIIEADAAATKGPDPWLALHAACANYCDYYEDQNDINTNDPVLEHLLRGVRKGLLAAMKMQRF